MKTQQNPQVNAPMRNPNANHKQPDQSRSPGGGSENVPKPGGRSDIVFRGGIATPQQLQKGIAEHARVEGLTGFSVQSAHGKTINELAAAGQFRNKQISVTTVGELEDAGWSLGFNVRVIPSPGRGFHNTVTTPNPLPDDLAEALSEVFRQMPNPSPF
ncbi:hypothetical protein FJZ31_39330 [Candidatus Poribacteria bacterium]|nr:hypothetical protein [Candidatus Poribacteria bacterium]